jgi:hypothetical protein
MRLKRILAAAALATSLFAAGGVAAQSADAKMPTPDTLQELCEAKQGTYFTGRFGEPRCQDVRSPQGDFSAEEQLCAEEFGATFRVDPSSVNHNRYAWICS